MVKRYWFASSFFLRHCWGLLRWGAVDPHGVAHLTVTSVESCLTWCTGAQGSNSVSSGILFLLRAGHWSVVIRWYGPSRLTAGLFNLGATTSQLGDSLPLFPQGNDSIFLLGLVEIFSEISHLKCFPQGKSWVHISYYYNYYCYYFTVQKPDIKC